MSIIQERETIEIKEEISIKNINEVKNSPLLNKYEDLILNKENENENENKNIVATQDSETIKKIPIESDDLNTENDKIKSNDLTKIVLNDEELNLISKEDLVKKWKTQNEFINQLENNLKNLISKKEVYQESEDKLKQQLFDLTRRENLLIMKLTSKEHEMQEYINQIQELKLSQIVSEDQLQNTLLDPAVNLIFEEMKKEVEKSKSKVEEMQNELSAWKFTPDSNTGKRLMAKCRLLYQENEELGKVITSGRIAKLEGELALQKSFSEEMKKSQGELDEFLFELDEDVEGMQSTIYYLQQQLKEAKEQIIKLQEETNRQKKTDFEENSENEKKLLTDEIIKNHILNDKKEIKNDNNLNNKEFENIDQNSLKDNKSRLNEDNQLQQLKIENSDSFYLSTNDSKANYLRIEENRKRCLEETDNYLGECGIDNIIRKHRKLEEKNAKECLAEDIQTSS